MHLHQRTALSSRRASWLVLRRPEDLSTEGRHMLDLLGQAHAQVTAACQLAQALAQMIRRRDASALEPWLEEATTSGVPELHTFAEGIRREASGCAGRSHFRMESRSGRGCAVSALVRSSPKERKVVSNGPLGQELT